MGGRGYPKFNLRDFTFELKVVFIDKKKFPLVLCLRHSSIILFCSSRAVFRSNFSTDERIFL